MAKTEYIEISVKVKITYDKGYKEEAIEKAKECVWGMGIYGGYSSAEVIGQGALTTPKQQDK